VELGIRSAMPRCGLYLQAGRTSWISRYQACTHSIRQRYEGHDVMPGWHAHAMAMAALTICISTGAGEVCDKNLASECLICDGSNMP
jgi:hypothetical protein